MRHPGRTVAAWMADRPQTPARTFLKGETSALAGAELQNLIKRVMEANDGLLVSSEFRQSTEPLPLTPITVVVRARSSIAALQRILLELDSGRPTLFVDRLSIQSRHRPGRVIRELNEELDVDFEVTGYVNRPFDP